MASYFVRYGYFVTIVVSVVFWGQNSTGVRFVWARFWLLFIFLFGRSVFNSHTKIAIHYFIISVPLYAKQQTVAAPKINAFMNYVCWLAVIHFMSNKISPIKKRQLQSQQLNHTQTHISTSSLLLFDGSDLWIFLLNANIRKWNASDARDETSGKPHHAINTHKNHHTNVHENKEREWKCVHKCVCAGWLKTNCIMECTFDTYDRWCKWWRSAGVRTHHKYG